MKTAVVQTNPVFGDKPGNLKDALRLMEGVDADLYVLPELFSSGYNFVGAEEVKAVAESFERGETASALADFARRQKAFVVYGFAERDGSSLYNSAGLLGYDGTRGLYRKIHLFDRETLFFQGGNLPFSVWDTPVGKIGIMVCFDWYFPESARTLALRGAEIIAHPSNLVLPHCPDAMKIRCLENRVFAATANRTGTETRGGHTLTYIGMSQITSPQGEVLHRSPGEGTDVGVCDLDLRNASDKSLNNHNDVLRDRRREFYF